MIIMSLGAGACTSETKIAEENTKDTMIVVDNSEDSGKDDKFLFKKDITGGNSNILKQIESDYTSKSFLQDIEEFKGSIDLILINFPNNEYLQYPHKETSIASNNRFIENIYEALSEDGKIVITSERNDQEESKKSLCNQYQTHPSYIPRGLNLDYLSTIEDITKNLDLLESKIIDEPLSEIEIGGKLIHLYPELGASYKLFNQYFQLKSLILSKI